MNKMSKPISVVGKYKDEVTLASVNKTFEFVMGKNLQTLIKS